MIAALSENRCIGRGNTLPWHLPEDLKHFRRITQGHPVVMGRKTFESIGKPLPGRASFVVTRDPKWSWPGVEVCPSVADAIARAETAALQVGKEEIFVIGGAEVYSQALPRAHRLYLTEVHALVEGDTFFPGFSHSEFREVSREEQPGDPAYAFVVLDRV